MNQVIIPNNSNDLYICDVQQQDKFQFIENFRMTKSYDYNKINIRYSYDGNIIIIHGSVFIEFISTQAISTQTNSSMYKSIKFNFNHKYFDKQIATIYPSESNDFTDHDICFVTISLNRSNQYLAIICKPYPYIFVYKFDEELFSNDHINKLNLQSIVHNTFEPINDTNAILFDKSYIKLYFRNITHTYVNYWNWSKDICEHSIQMNGFFPDICMFENKDFHIYGSKKSNKIFVYNFHTKMSKTLQIMGKLLKMHCSYKLSNFQLITFEICEIDKIKKNCICTYLLTEIDLCLTLKHIVDIKNRDIFNLNHTKFIIFKESFGYKIDRIFLMSTITNINIYFDIYSGNEIFYDFIRMTNKPYRVSRCAKNSKYLLIVKSDRNNITLIGNQLLPGNVITMINNPSQDLIMSHAVSSDHQLLCTIKNE